MTQALSARPEARASRTSAATTSSDSSRADSDTTVYLVDDHPAIREALASAVATTDGLRVVGDSARAEDALPAIEQDTPDIVVVDLSLQGKDGLTLVEHIRTAVPDARILIFSMYDETVYAERAIRAGASGYVMKSAPTQTVVHAIEEVSEGQVFLNSEITSRILSKVIRSDDYASQSRLDELTDRELTVFRMLGEGSSVREIADQLDLNRKTIETYRRRAKEKLGHDSVNGLLQHAARWANDQG